MSTPRQDCPNQEMLQELAAGIGSPEMAQRTTQHIARCSTCAAALRRYIHEFSPEQSREDIEILNRLQSSKSQWQKRLVRELVGSRNGFRWLKFVPAAAALAVAILAVVEGPVFLAQFKVKQAQKQVAAAFVQRRTTEMRLPGVDYSPFNPFPVTLGPEGGRGLDEVPTSLHEASGAANKSLESGHPDPQWLQIQGRALLWESTPGSLEKAEKDFERARLAGLATASLEIDLAASYFERDSKAEHPNLQRTLNLLSEVLSKPNLSKEDRASALYNLALAYEKTQAWDLAVSTWEKFLETDSTSGWAEQARQHLKEGKAKTISRQQQSYSDPSFFLQQKAQGSLRPEDPEQYQQKALTQWLPVAVADRGSDAYRAVGELAEVFAEHQDFWWRDFLKAVEPGDQRAVRDLSGAIQNNEKGRYDEALAQSRRAAAAFVRHGNHPAQLLAGFAEVYALRNKLQGANCLVRAGPVLERLSGTSYRWLQAQVLLEDAQCRNFQIQLAEADHDSNLSLSIATSFDLPVQKLRILGISAGMKHQQGKCDESWSLGVAGLGSFWQGAYPWERLDQFYAVMWQCARETGSLYLAENLLRRTIAMREDPQTLMQRNSIREGMLHLRLANILLALRKADLAEAESRRASSLLKDTDQVYAKDYVLRTKIEPAEMQLQHGDAELALTTLQPVEQLLTSIQDKFIVVSFYRVLGNIHWQLGRLAQASAAYQSAVDLAEMSLTNLKGGPERLAWLRAADESYRGLVRVLLEQKKPEEALERWDWYKGRPMLQDLRVITHSQKGKGPSGAKNNPGASMPAPDRVRLIYASFKDGVQIWVRSSRGVNSAWVDWKQQDFERTVREFAEHCSDPDSKLTVIQEQGSWLYAKLLGPVMSALSDSDAVIVDPDRLAYNLPMEALREPGGRYFGEQYHVVYSPGVRAEENLRKNAPVSPQAAILILDASHVPKSGFLPGVEAQGKAIAGMFPRSTILDSTGIAWPEVRRRLDHSAVFHYMGHGRADGSGTALAFSSNRSLSAKDFSPEFFRNTQLVVLAACSTAKGRDNGLWDSDSLVHALLRAGVPQIIASHWNVDSRTTSQFMISFYQHVKAGRAVDEAAFDARKETLAKAPHPYYWAGFSVTGRVN
jgi:CHAT domain-containing protein